MTENPIPPAGLGPEGIALFEAISARYALDPHEIPILRELARAVDRLEQLTSLIASEGLLDTGTGKVHPAVIEARQQQLAVVKLTTALRIPAEDGARTTTGAALSDAMRGVAERRWRGTRGA